jgi:hypothetical protein
MEIITRIKCSLREKDSSESKESTESRGIKEDDKKFKI